MNERSRLLVLSGAIWLIVTVVVVVFAMLGRIPWDGYAHLPWWISVLLGFSVSSLQIVLIYWLTRHE